MLKALRDEIHAQASTLALKRSLSLRRCDPAKGLFVCDLPRFAAAEEAASFRKGLERKGWACVQESGMLFLTKDIPLPESCGDVSAGGETGCCLDLMRIHPDGPVDGLAVRAIAQAAEQNAAVLERLCLTLHRQWAEALRLGKPLPSKILPYLEQAIREVSV